MVEERTQQRLLRTAISQRLANSSAQMPDILRNKVGQIDMFGPVPHLFVGIKFRGIGGKPFDEHPFLKPLHQLPGRTAMHHPAIPDQDNPFRKVLQQRRDKRDRFLGGNILVKQLEVKSQTSADRRNGDRRDRREPIPTIPTVVDRCLPSRSPSPPYHRLKHKPAFIRKNDGFTAFSGVFLSAASRFLAMPRWLLRRVREPAVRASGNSIPSESAHARLQRHRNALRTVFLARQPHGTGSTGCWHTRVFRAPAAAAFAATLFGRLSIWQDDLYAGWVSGLGGRAVDRRFSIVKPLPGLPQNAERFSSRTSPVPATRWLPACVAPFLRLIVSSSYRIQSAKSGCLNEFFKGQ